MKSIKFSLVAGALALSSLIAAGSALAGEHYAVPVSIRPGLSASGSLRSARDSSDQNQYIVCAVYGWANGQALYCVAQDSQRNYLSCYSSAPNLIAAAQAISETSNIIFYVDQNGECTDVYVSNESVVL